MSEPDSEVDVTLAPGMPFRRLSVGVQSFYRPNIPKPSWRVDWNKNYLVVYWDYPSTAIDFHSFMAYDTHVDDCLSINMEVVTDVVVCLSYKIPTIILTIPKELDRLGEKRSCFFPGQPGPIGQIFIGLVSLPSTRMEAARQEFTSLCRYLVHVKKATVITAEAVEQIYNTFYNPSDAVRDQLQPLSYAMEEKEAAQRIKDQEEYYAAADTDCQATNDNWGRLDGDASEDSERKDEIEGEKGRMGIEESAEAVIFRYPPMTGSDIYAHDIKCLEKGKYFNDSIMCFGFNVLKEYLQLVCPKTLEKSHFYDPTLSELLREIECRPEAFERLCNWTAKVDLFEKQFLLVPYCQEVHWYLFIVYRPGAGLKVQSAITYIFVLDSLGIGRLDEPTRFAEYLEKEALHRKLLDANISYRYDIFQIPVPEQLNGFDCGPHVLHAAELFLLNWKILLPYMRDMDVSTQREKAENIWRGIEAGEVRHKLRRLASSFASSTQS